VSLPYCLKTTSSAFLTLLHEHDALYFSAAEENDSESFCWYRKKECSDMRMISVFCAINIK
ncbi:hypothetical protein L210DRAFT_939026, partial [Boletus edulis BED1]